MMVWSVWQDYVAIMEFLMKHWKIGSVTGLKADGLKAQEDLQNLLKKFQRLTEMQVCKRHKILSFCTLVGSGIGHEPPSVMMAWFGWKYQHPCCCPWKDLGHIY
jgi:hypothetical protein